MILFIDGLCPHPYSSTHNVGNGGTEGTVVKIAEALAASGLEVAVEQHNRTEAEGRYLPLGTVKEAKHVIALRTAKTAISSKERFNRAKVYLWTHDLAGTDLGHGVPELIKGNVDVLCVSNYHRNQTIEVIRNFGYTGQFRTHMVYNPIPNDTAPDNTLVNKNKLIFTASPHKGIVRTLSIFKNLLTFNPKFKLYITNPGYLPDVKTDYDNVVVLGSLPHKEVLQHVRESLCLFYMNDVFPETFGLIMAEANAVGTPYLTHNLGAAAEVADHPAQIIDTRSNKAVIDRVMNWHNGERPIVRGRDEFKLSNVIKTWYKLLK